MTNVPKQQQQPVQQPPQNQPGQAPVDTAAGDGGGGDGPAEPQPSTSNGSNGYDASKSRKKHKDKESEPWQEKVLKFLEPVDVAPVAPPPKKDYIDVALEAISVQCKENLNKDEILDVVDDIQQLVSRVCRDKRRREQLQRNPPPPPAAAGGFQQDLQGAMALPPMGYNNEPQFYNM